MAGIQLASGFDLNSPAPLDSRFQVENITERNAIPTGNRYEGLFVYVKADKKYYSLTGGVANANWSEMPTPEALTQINAQLAEIEQNKADKTLINTELSGFQQATNNLTVKVLDVELNKADKTTTSNLQTQINDLVVASGDETESYAEIVQARSDLNGNSFPTIKSHFDNIETILINGQQNLIFNDWERGSLNNGANSNHGNRIRTANYHEFSVGTSIVIQPVEGYRVSLAFYDSNHAFDAYASNFGWITTPTTITVPLPYARFFVASVNDASVVPVANSGYFVLTAPLISPPVKEVISSIRSDVSALKDFSSTAKIYAPKTIYHLGKGNYKRFFKENIISAYNMNDFMFAHPGGVFYGEYQDYTNIPKNQTADLHISIRNVRNGVAVKQVSISSVYVNPLTKRNPATVKNVLMVGDSYTDRGWLPCKIKDLLVNEYGFSNFNFIGENSDTLTIGTREVTCANQGRGGGMILDYIKTDNTLGQGWANPFNNNGTISISNYMAKNNFGNLDICIIELGVNDLIISGNDTELIKTRLKALIDHIHADYPNCKIYVVGLVYISKNNNNKNAVKHNRDAMEINEAYESLCLEPSYSTFCSYIDVGISFLIDYGFPYQMVSPYEGMTEQVKVITDWLHPSPAGFYMEAENIVASIVHGLDNNG